MTPTLSDKVQKLCNDQRSVISILAGNTGSQHPHEASEQLLSSHVIESPPTSPPAQHQPAASEDLEKARNCGKWGQTQPTDLFLNIWHDALKCLEHDPLAGVVSPSLMGSSGTVPFTIIAPLPDICRHMSNLIARAQHEVILATNYWKESQASTLITDSLKELSRRAGARGSRAVVKIIYDRGSIKQVLNNHLEVGEAEWTASGVALPSKADLPHLDLEVVNYHRPALGTFHAKFMIVDRQVAIVQSNNVQDNDNLEMMSHLEGPIVDSLYDMALLTWSSELKPPLPLLREKKPVATNTASYETQTFIDLAEDFPHSICHKAKELNEKSGRLPRHDAGNPQYDPDLAGEMTRMQSQLTPLPGEAVVDLVAGHLNASTKQTLKATAPPCPIDENMTPFIIHAVHDPFPIALVNRKPHGALNHASVHTPQNEAWLSAIRHAQSSIFIQSPDVNAAPLIPALQKAVRRGVEVIVYACLGYNDLGELLPYQGGTNEMIAHKMYMELEPEHRKHLRWHWYVAKDQTKPLHNKFKQRSCHIKLMIVDSRIAIQGSGNQDTQSWYHSQEVNVLIDSELVCRDWLAALKRNQNTHLYGAVSQEDGVWRDENGKEAEGAMGINPGHFSWAKGMWGAVQRVRGAGGF
ncbi:phospholipase D active site motif protein [Elsinoe ampelina]|uniref:Phospholipase D active site motif protein n=1 Tax=Elsinoe ampelina TaxID=302913 RepID=A0A6A6G8M6_9PEZI|nr:phospholipase D active site motif protein [Elsinoe ampelina]